MSTLDGGLINDDLIDDSGFGELGLPTSEQMLRQQCTLLIAEIEILQSELTRSRSDLCKTIGMFTTADSELTKLKAEHERVRWKLSAIYLKQSQDETAKMTYQYGDHTNRTDNKP